MTSEQAVEEVASWFAYAIIADEVHAWDPLPGAIRDEIAAVMVRDQDRLGWPDLDVAQATLDQWEWA